MAHSFSLFRTSQLLDPDQFYLLMSLSSLPKQNQSKAMKVHLLDLLQQSNKIDHFIDTQIKSLPDETRKMKVNEDTWSVIEVIEHLNLVFELYHPRISEVLNTAKPRQEVTEISKASWKAGLFVSMMEPKGQKRKYKMKTFKFYEPHFTDSETVLSKYLDYRKVFNEYIQSSRNLEVDRLKIVSAISIVKFTIPEALAFMLAHEQRHIVQMEEVINAISQ